MQGQRLGIGRAARHPGHPFGVTGAEFVGATPDKIGAEGDKLFVDQPGIQHVGKEPRAPFTEQVADPIVAVEDRRQPFEIDHTVAQVVDI